MFPTEGFQPSLSKLTAVLDRLGIKYHLTGGIASIAYGEPRMTQDVDLVLDPDRVVAVEDEFLGALARAGFHFGEPTARQAIASRQMFQLLDVDQVIKLDLYVRCLIRGNSAIARCAPRSSQGSNCLSHPAPTRLFQVGLGPARQSPEPPRPARISQGRLVMSFDHRGADGC